MKQTLLFFLLLALAGVFGGSAYAQCVYTTTGPGNLNDPSIYSVGCTTPPTSTSTIIIKHAVVLSANFTVTSGSITIIDGGSLRQPAGSNFTLTIDGSNRNNVQLTILASSTERGLPTLSVGVLNLEKTTVIVGANTVVEVVCTLFIDNQGLVRLGANSLLNVLRNLDVGTGNGFIQGPGAGVPAAGIRVGGNIVGNPGGGGTLYNTTNIIVCVQGLQPPSSNCGPPRTDTVNPPTGTINDPTCVTVLPVTLTRFAGGRTSNGGVSLSWATATEINNSYFAVERSADGRAFVTLAKVAGAGTTSSRRDYSYDDEKSLTGETYYRLRQVDIDGTISYSPVVVVAAQSKQDALAYPNPSTGTMKLPATVGTVRYRILNVLGQTLLSGQATGNDVLDLTKVPKGPFFLEMTGAAGRTTQRLVRE